MDDGWAHVCSTGIACPAAAAMAYLAAPERLALWARGLGEATVHPDGLIEGAFPGTGEPILARIDADRARSVIQFHLGADRDRLQPRILLRVVPGAVLGRNPDHCLVTLIAWRQESMDDRRWAGLKAGHEEEILVIRRLVEAWHGQDDP